MFTCVSQWKIPNNIEFASLTVSVQKSHIFISDWYNHCIQIFDLNGMFIDKIGGDNIYNFYWPGIMHIDFMGEKLFVPDCLHNRVVIFDMQEYLHIFGADANPHDMQKYLHIFGTDTNPYSVCCSNNGDKIFVAGGFTPSWVEVYDRHGTKISKHSDVKFGSDIKNITYNNITHEVFVADYGNDRIVVLDENGKFKRTFGKKGSGSGEFNLPWQLSIDEISNILFVADMNNDRIQIVRCSDGSHICSIHNIEQPRGVYYDSNSQCVYIINHDTKVFIFKHLY